MKDSLKKVLKKYDPGKKLKIGTENGSLWFYVGTVGDYLKNFEEIDKKLRKKAKKNLMKSIQEFNSNAGKMEMPGIINEDEDTLQTTETIRFMMIARRMVAFYFRYIEYAELSNRVPCEVFEADMSVDEDCINVIIPGYERGYFWDCTEAEPGTLKFSNSLLPSDCRDTVEYFEESA